MNKSATGAQSTGLTVRDAVFRILRHYGMTTIFGNPGSTELPMFSDLPEDFRYVMGLQESTVVAMADGHALASRRPAFVNLHSAAGVGHAMGSIYSAFRNRAPIVITAGQQSRSLLAHDPFLFAQNPTELPQPYVKWAIEPTRAEDVPAAIARAIQIAMLPPQGPVFVSVPLDDWAAPAPAPKLRMISADAQLVPEAVAGLAARLRASTKPVLVVGAGLDADGAWDEGIALAEALQSPVWAAPLSSRCSFPEDHPLFAGFLPANAADISLRLAGHDLGLVLGAPVFTYHYERAGQVPPAGLELIQITDDPQQAASAVAGDAIVARLRPTLVTLLDKIGPARTLRPAPMRRIAAPLPPADGGNGTISTAIALKLLADLRPKDCIIVEEAPSARDDVHDHLPIHRAGGFFATASGGLGYAMPAGVGVALTRPGHPVLAVIGDGSAMYSIQAIWSAVEENADILFVILNNGGYAALKGFAGNMPVEGCVIDHLSLSQLAEGQGCPAQRVSDPQQLDAVLRDAFAATGPRLVEIMIGAA